MDRRRLLFLILPMLAGLLVLPLYSHKARKKRHRRPRTVALVPTIPAIAVVPRPTVSYVDKIKPLLSSRCVVCHGPNRSAGGLRLDTVAAILKGGRHGPVVVGGNSESSLLLRSVTADDEVRMPRDGPRLSPAEIDLLTRWIDEGAPGPLDERSEAGIGDHWAFRTPTTIAVPGTSPGSNPIDAFLQKARHDKSLRHTGPLDKGRLLRRLSLDLIGLPPSLDDLDAFLEDSSCDAYERVVDRLLASPRHGERWARHWMDIWRYADEDGRRDNDGNLKEVNWSSPHLWRWRDWIIHSLNEDKGYDRMIVEMLAGDELPGKDASSLSATGFLVRNHCTLDRNLSVSMTVEHTAKAFLGVTLACARCHDHKFDPLSQEEYYRFRAIFEPHDVHVIDQTMPGGEIAKIACVHEANPIAPTYLFDRGNEKQPIASIDIKPGVPKALGGLALSWSGGAGGRRLALARWMTDPRNPLTARVAVNHVWFRHFGKALVDTPSDFGRRGKAASHPELLDWLALELVRHDWSFKWLHRLIVTSDAYRMHSATMGLEETAAADPDNVFLWRANSRRMEAEVVRDSLLSLAGRLDGRIGGPNEGHTAADRSPRRSLYLRGSREDRVLFLSHFDPPSLEECYERRVSIVPQQADTLSNAPFVWQQSELIAARLPADTEDFVRCAFRWLLCRPPSDDEANACRQFLQSFDQNESTKRSPRAYLVHALLNHNDFITIR